jgi:DNA polymerase I-like protein with 3'-5' exonuclease and polymerase domains
MKKYVAFDLECDGLLATVTSIHCGCFISLDPDDVFRFMAIGTDDVVETVSDLVARGYTLVIHNAAFDVAVLRKFDAVIPPGSYVCTMVAHHKIYTGMYNYSLDALADNYRLERKINYKQALIDEGLWFGEGSEWDVPYSQVMHDYCTRDTEIAGWLWQEALLHFERDKRLATSFWQVHMPFVEVIMSTSGGLYMNPTKVVTLAQELTDYYAQAEAGFLSRYPKVIKLRWDKQLAQYVPSQPTEFKPPNLKSPNDVCSLLLANGWTPQELSEAGRPKTDQATLRYCLATEPEGTALHTLMTDLQSIKSDAGILSQLRTLCKHLGDDFYLRGNWKQCATVTHRLSSSAPNMQNLSTRNPRWGSKMRSLFTPPPGYAMLLGDFSQIELAILAYYLEEYNDDSTMAEAAREGRDFHDANTEAWYQITKDEEQFGAKRKVAKNGIFGANYGAGAKRLAFTLGISISEALEILLTVDERTSINGLKRKVWAVAADVRDVKPVQHGHRRFNSGFLYDYLGTRVCYPNINSTKSSEVAGAKRQLFNALMQTGCFSILADRCNAALPHIQKAGGWFAALVHDEAMVYVPEAEANSLLVTLNEVFGAFVLKTAQGGVPVRCEFELLNNWSEK